ncbi:MAG: hypothetical protein JO076_04165 [Verrucomicrobia bacterium]|nr:hypothetical protein [Verrucomicrobiota bacterium]
MNIAWYCLRSQPKHEHIAARHLQMLQKTSVFCPRIRFKRLTRQGIVRVTEAMFPSYLFARFDLSSAHRQVRYSPGVSAIVHFAGRYPTVGEEIVAQLRNHTGETEIRELDDELSAGDPVKIADGVFAGLETVVTRVLPAKERVKVLMDFLGRQMETEIESCSVLRRFARSIRI